MNWMILPPTSSALPGVRAKSSSVALGVVDAPRFIPQSLRPTFMPLPILLGGTVAPQGPACGASTVASADPGHLDPGAVLVRAGDGGLDEGHAGDAVEDAGVLERRRNPLAPGGADRPFEGPVQVGERLVEPFGVARGGPHVRLDRAGDVAVLGPLAIDP